MRATQNREAGDLEVAAVEVGVEHEQARRLALDVDLWGVARTVIEGAAGAILWTHGAEILAALLEAWRRAGT